MQFFLKTINKNKTVNYLKNFVPAQLYLALSILSILAIFTQN